MSSQQNRPCIHIRTLIRRIHSCEEAIKEIRAKSENNKKKRRPRVRKQVTKVRVKVTTRSKVLIAIGQSAITAFIVLFGIRVLMNNQY